MVSSRKPEKAGRMLKRQLQSLGALRDIHVQRIFIEGQSVRFPELVLLQDHLGRRERELVRAATQQIHSIKTKKLEKRLFNLTAVLSEKENDGSSRKAMSAAAFRCAEDAFGQVVERRRLIDFSDLRTVHRTRVAFKKFRYVVESLPPEATGLSKRELRFLAWYQRRMGNIQDLEVLQACLTDFLNRHEDCQRLLAPFCSYLRHRQARALGAFRKSVDRLFQFWPPQGQPRSSVLHQCAA
jgi:CHAD domain-containing protein